MKNKHFVVFNDNDLRKLHSNLDKAKEEAREFLRKTPSHKYTILETVMSCSSIMDIKWDNHGENREANFNEKKVKCIDCRHVRLERGKETASILCAKNALNPSHVDVFVETICKSYEAKETI